MKKREEKRERRKGNGGARGEWMRRKTEWRVERIRKDKGRVRREGYREIWGREMHYIMYETLPSVLHILNTFLYYKTY